MTAPELLQEVTRLGVALKADGPRLRLNPRSAIPPSLVPELRAHKEEILELLRSGGWPAECLEAERRFGQPHARLFPLLDRLVETPIGRGRLLQVFAERAAVCLDSSQGALTFLLPEEIWPLGGAVREEGRRVRWTH